MSHRTILASACIATTGLIAAPAWAGSHTWDIIEAFSNADGTIQFIELREMNGTAGETALANKSVTSSGTGEVFTFPSNLVGPTSNKSILLATDGYAALPGVPARDHEIVANFIDLKGDTLTYHVYDTFTFGALPTDCINSMNDGGVITQSTPRNYAGAAGTVDCSTSFCSGDITGPDGLGNPDGNVDSLDFLAMIGQWGSPCAGSCEADITGSTPGTPDGNVDSLDFLALIGQWGSPGNCP